jgi:membrane protein DedA with SNARE-associated domain
LLILALHLHLHLLHHRGAAIDYAAVAVSAAISWIIGIGPGEPAVIAAGVFAAKHKLDISPLIFWAWVGSAAGGIVGWLIGMKAGHAVLTAPGPFRAVRLRAVTRGEEVFRRMEVLAIVATPSWVAGVNRSRARLYIPTNLVSALLLWAAPLGLGAYFAGPPVLDLFSDAGAIISTVGIVALVGGVAATLFTRSKRSRGRGNQA